MKPQDEYVSLLPLLSIYLQRPFSELPKELQERLDAEEFEIGAGGFSWDELTPYQRHARLTGMDKKGDPRYELENIVCWCDVNMDARAWLDMPNVEPKDAAMVLSRINPLKLAVGEDPESIYVDDDRTSPHRYRLLMQMFESVASASPKPRTLMEWRAIAQQRNLRYHSWLDDYIAATEALTGKPFAPVTEDNRKRSDALTEEYEPMLLENPKLTATQLMARLLERIGEPGTCILCATGDGLQWEPYRGEPRTLTLKQLEDRIARWRKKNKTRS